MADQHEISNSQSVLSSKAVSVHRTECVKAETTNASQDNLTYNGDEEPELYLRTWLAVAAMFMLNFVHVFALMGPPAVLSYIGTSLNNSIAEPWVPSALSLVQGVLGPIIASASDTFQARKSILVVTCLISFVGAGIAPGSHSIYRVIAAQTLIGFGFASVPLAYCIPSEILPRRWRPLAQAVNNFAALLGATVGPLTIGALTKASNSNGWRTYYWIQMGMWGLTALGIFLGYRPPKRHTRLDHLSFVQKLQQLDLPGSALLTTGLTLFLTGLNLGGGLYSWTNARVLSTLVIGLVILAVFGVWEWKGTTNGILNHEIFKGGKDAGRTFAICLGLMFIEGVMLFSYVIFYPILTTNLFETDPFLVTARLQPHYIASIIATMVYAVWSARLRTIRAPLLAGFALWTAGIIGLSTIQPGQSINSLAFAALSGAGFGAPLILIITGVQLSTPHQVIATATAVTTSCRAIAATVFTAIFIAAFTTRVSVKVPVYVSTAVLEAGLPSTSVDQFMTAFTAKDQEVLAQITGITPEIITVAAAALKQAFADSIRVVYFITIPFGIVACIGCLFLGDMKATMNYHVDAPLEQLRAKSGNDEGAGGGRRA
ncbi:putative siderophore iron transporter [Phaeosphaeria sp. MPI-PUGE-AT-0046c]|nr:putative siderophore iron transporter [Phaeosphaeria sp. MPI-PUGE-AT-0046c]